MFVAAWLIKSAQSSGIAPHLDWSMVEDEASHPTYNVFVATSDVSAESGALCVVPGSHHLVDFPRRAVENHLDWATATFESLAERSVLVPLRPGQALVYDIRLLHHSTPNVSGSPRIVASFGIAPEAECADARALLELNLGLIGLAVAADRVEPDVLVPAPTPTRVPSPESSTSRGLSSRFRRPRRRRTRPI